MPEGDTLYKAAERLRPALEGAELTRFEARRLKGLRPRPGERIDWVRSHGKHLLIACSGGLVVQTHLQMAGTWRLVKAGDRWPRPAHLLRCRVDVEGWQALCFSAPTVRTWPVADVDTDRSPLAHLGPDLCRSESVPEAVVALMGSLTGPDAALGDVLLDQRVFCGVGNVYRNEVCWALRLHPATPMGLIADGVRRRLAVTAARQLRANLGAGPRRTVSGGLAVYGRAGSGCRRCRTRIVTRRMGEGDRVTFWCPRCQPTPNSAE
ncbi:MAG: DNA-formamidopyrimidine glycosylase family protein [Microthrixaceae bacterium]